MASVDDRSYVALSLAGAAYAEIVPDLGIPLDGTVPFSVDAWVRPHGLPASGSILSKDGVFFLGVSADCLVVQFGGQAAVASDPSKQALVEERWHHVCVTYSAAQVGMYIDGYFNGLQSISVPGGSGSAPYRVGENLEGLFYEVRVYNTALAADAVRANMFGTPAPSTLVVDLSFGEDPPWDHGGHFLPITLHGGAAMQTNVPAVQLGGTAFAHPLWSSAVNPGGQQVDPYTVQAWIRVDSDQQPSQAIFVNSDLESDTGIALMLAADPSGGVRVQSQRGSNVTTAPLESTRTLAAGEWHNVATTFDGTTLAIYLNGALDTSAPAGPIALTRNQSDLVIGAALSEGFPSGATTLQGSISRLEVWNRALSATEVKLYVGNVPVADEEGLDAAWDFTSAPPRNTIDGRPVGLADGATLHEHLTHDGVGAVPIGGTVAAPRWADLDAATLEELRASLDLTGFLAEHGDDLARAKAADVAAFTEDADRDLIARAWDDVLERMERDPASLPFFASSHVVGGERIWLCHSRGETWVAYRGPLGAVDDCTMWHITLVFVLVAGALDALFAVRPTLGPEGIRYLQRVIARPSVAVPLGLGTMTASSVFGYIGMLISEGLLRELVRLTLAATFWVFLRVTIGLVMTFLGVRGAALLASLVATAVTFGITYRGRPSSCDPFPAIDLAGVKFNWDPTRTATDALSIRRNRTTDLPAAEWTKRVATAAESPAAYAIAAVSGKTITIQARFLIADQSAKSAQIKADGGGVLGAIAPFTVNFANGVSSPQWVTISLPSHQLAAGGVGRTDIQWSWSYQPPGGAWTPLATTKHRIYAVLATPTMPWVQGADPTETQLPWTDVLDYACAWAQGAKTADAAASAVTTKVNGGLNLVYENSLGASVYVDDKAGQFLCTAFVAFLRGGGSLGPKVGCTDCASIVTAFANVLGCNLFAGMMVPAAVPPATVPPLFFTCNQLQLIGSSAWAYPDPRGARGFKYHEIPWTGTGSYSDTVYDACLKVDGGTNPWDWSAGTTHTPMLARNVVFATRGPRPALPIATPFNDVTYRERLVTNDQSGIGACFAVPPRDNTQSGRRKVF